MFTTITVKPVGLGQLCVSGTGCLMGISEGKNLNQKTSNNIIS